MAMAVCWKPPSTIRDPSNCATSGVSESRESAKASTLPARSSASASSTEATGAIVVFQRTGGGADGRGVGDADDVGICPVDVGHRLEAGGGGGDIGAFNQKVGRPE